MKKLHLLKTMLLLCALIVGSGTMWADDTYVKVTSTSDLEVDGQYLIVNTAGTYAAGKTSTTSTKYATTVSVTVSNNEIKNPNSNVAVYTLGGNSTNGWTFYSSKDSKYLSWTSGNSLNVNASISNNTRWSISLSSGTATISNKATTDRVVRFNSDRFACYTSNTGTLVSLYKKQTAAKSTAPTIDDGEAASNFTISKDVTITAADGATIYYTTDGTDPTTSSSTYSSAIHITSTTTIKAAALEDGKTLSSISSKTFTKVLADNTITVTGGTTPSVDRTGGSAVDDWTPTASATSGGTINYAVKSTTNLTQGTDFTFNTSTGKVSFSTTYKGIIVITASVDADDDYASASQDITLTVNGDRRDPVNAYDGEDTEISSTGSLVIDTDLIETDGAITVESSDTGVATVSEYTISAVADGTTTITINTAAGTYYNAGSATFELIVVTPSACDIALTGAPVSKTFDVYNNATPQVISYTTSSVGTVSIASSAYASFEIDQVNKKITVTPKSKTPSAQTITINQAAAGRYLAGSTTFSLTVNNSATSETYEKVTNAATLTVGDEVAIVNEEKGKAAGTVSNELLTPVGITITSNTFSTTSGVVTYILGGTSGAWTLQKKGDTNYLSSTTVKKMALVASDYSTWAISISEGNATMTSSAISGGDLQYNYNSGNDRFTTYTSSQSAIQLYKRGKYDNVITVTNGLEQTLELESETDLTLSATSYCGAVSFAFKSATNLTKDTDFTFNPETGELSVNEGAVSGTITITASTSESATHKAASSDIVISVVGKPVDPDFSGIEDVEKLAGTTYTLVNGEHFTTDGSVTLSSSNSNIASVSGLVITANAVGTATITVTAAQGTMYKSGSKTFDITVTAPTAQSTVDDIVLLNETFASCDGTGEPGSFKGTGSKTIIADVDGWAFTKGDAANGCAKFGSSGNTGSATTPSMTVTSGKSYKLTFKCAPWDEESNSVKVTVTGGTINGKASVTTSTLTEQEWNEEEYTIVATASTMSLTFEKGGSENRFFLDDIKVTTPRTATVTLNAKGYATFCSQYPMDFSKTTGYTAWRISEIDGNTITFNKITEAIKGGQGVLLYNKNADDENTSNVTVNFASSSKVFTSSENLLVGTTAPLYVTVGEYYGLSGDKFVPVTPAGNVPAGKALLPADALSSAREFNFVFLDEETTGISASLNDKGQLTNDKVVYDLQGRKVAQPNKGLYIVNGRKVIIK